jgi:hypothetical protein
MFQLEKANFAVGSAFCFERIGNQTVQELPFSN